MRMFLVDHGYGAALVYAQDRDDAAMIGDALGEVKKVVPCNISMAFGIDRETLPSEETDGKDLVVLNVTATQEWEFYIHLEALLKKHQISLDREDYLRMHPKERTPEDDPREPPPKPLRDRVIDAVLAYEAKTRTRANLVVLSGDLFQGIAGARDRDTPLTVVAIFGCKVGFDEALPSGTIQVHRTVKTKRA